MKSLRSRGIAQVFIAGVLYSTAGLFTRALHYDAWTVLAWRAVYASVFIAMFIAVTRRRAMLQGFAFGMREWAMVPMAAAGGVCYIFALKVTTVADVMVVYATMPFVTAIVAWLWGRDVPSRRLLLASFAALGGVAVMVVGGSGDGQRLLGISLTLCMNIAFATTLVGARHNPHATTALYLTGTVVNAVVGFWLAPAQSVDAGDMGLLIGFGLVTGLAMTLFMSGARMIPPSEVGLIGTADVVIGPALVWVGFAEVPSLGAVVGGIIVVGALLWHLWPDFRGGGGSRRPAGAPCRPGLLLRSVRHCEPPGGEPICRKLQSSRLSIEKAFGRS